MLNKILSLPTINGEDQKTLDDFLAILQKFNINIGKPGLKLERSELKLKIHIGTNNEVKYYLFKFLDDAYIDIFIKDGKIKGYGVVDIHDNKIHLAFHKFNKSAGTSEFWSGIYIDRLKLLKKHLIKETHLEPTKSYFSISDHQIISEVQLKERIQHYMFNRDKYHEVGPTTDRITDYAYTKGSLIDLEDERIASYDDFQTYYSFGPAAAFYLRHIAKQINFTIEKKEHAEERTIPQHLLEKIQDENQRLSEIEIIELIGGMKLVIAFSDIQ